MATEMASLNEQSKELDKAKQRVRNGHLGIL